MGCTCKRVLFITGLFLMELVDLVLDWYFSLQINKTEQEPIRSENALQYSILSFSIVGTFTFILQLLALYVDGKKDYSQMTYSTAMSVISTLFEDLPQIMLAAWVAAVSSESEKTVMKHQQKRLDCYSVLTYSVSLKMKIRSGLSRSKKKDNF
ncbi:unnamed protein product [Mytilus edulis]|uniref:Uncharacterized protein n=1 Tax=Mytilus edulis TaxID=6550 RepID=A0A8S3UYB3_MYTED|nr:unnamed protein product [Mytilus edulis]